MFRLAVPAGWPPESWAHGDLAEGTWIISADRDPAGQIYDLIDADSNGVVSAQEIIDANSTQNFDLLPAGSNDIVAQTIIASSYGLMQVMYSTGVFMGYRGRPSDMFELDVILDLSCGYLRRRSDEYINQSWETRWLNALEDYNGDRAYAEDVINTYAPLCWPEGRQAP